MNAEADEMFEDVPPDDPGEPLRSNGQSPEGIPAWAPPAIYSYGADFDPTKIPLREWIIGYRRARGEVTCDAGPPGVNKSSLMLIDAVSLVTGRSLLADDVWKSGEVLFLVGEDGRRDVEARLAAILEFYHLEPAELGGRLHVVYLSEIPEENYTLARMADDVAQLNANMVRWLRDLPNVLAVFVDPIAAWHRLIENSNDAFYVLCRALKSIAVQGNRHLAFDHHVNKASMSDPEAHVHNLAALRGAGVIGADVRWAFTLAKLKDETAREFGIPEGEHWLYRRLDPLKASYGKDHGPARLLKVEAVRIANGEQVGVLAEVDIRRVREDAGQRRETAKHEERQKLAEAFTRMLAEKRPRSANDAALWLISRAPELFKNKANGKSTETVSERTLRGRLPSLIGAGIETTYKDKPARIVLQSPEKNGNRSQIDFEREP